MRSTATWRGGRGMADTGRRVVIPTKLPAPKADTMSDCAGPLGWSVALGDCAAFAFGSQCRFLGSVVLGSDGRQLITIALGLRSLLHASTSPLTFTIKAGSIWS